ncbi:MAG: DUF2064 domain-containing protein, partial [Bacteroidota bacterium]
PLKIKKHSCHLCDIAGLGLFELCQLKLQNLLLQTDAHIALLFFSRRAGAEQQAKPHQGQGQKVHQALIDHSYQIAKASELPVFWISEAEQKGDSFGERLAHAYESVFAAGYEKVIAIGNDCLDLDAKALQSAANRFAKQDWILGPALDGGVYLLGMSKAVYQREAFLRLDWEMDSLFVSLQSLIASQGAAASILVSKADLDDSDALIRALKAAGKSFYLTHLLALLTKAPTATSVYQIVVAGIQSLRLYGLRAPPVSN